MDDRHASVAAHAYTTSHVSRSEMPRALRSILSLEDFEPAARRYLPRRLFAYVSGGVERNVTRDGNRTAFDALRFRPRVLIDTTARTGATTLFGHTYAAPFGIAPMGAAGLIGYRADLALARAARDANVPFILSGSSLIPMERIVAENPQAWFQGYLAGEREHIDALIERVARAGFRTLVITADVPVPGNRENNVRAGFSTPLTPSLGLALDGIAHPRWLLGTALRTLWTDGMPHFENLAATRGVPLLSSVAQRAHVRDRLNWSDLAWLRERWRGSLVVKGILAPEDAAIARDMGIDGLIVSNHGGRQLDGAVSPLDALPAIAAVAGSMTIMMDSGIRRGTDVLKALAIGARFVFAGRPFLYAASLGEQDGVAHAIGLLDREIDRDMALLGCTDLSDLTSRLMTDAGAR